LQTAGMNPAARLGLTDLVLLLCVDDPKI